MFITALFSTAAVLRFVGVEIIFERFFFFFLNSTSGLYFDLCSLLFSNL